MAGKLTLLSKAIRRHQHQTSNALSLRVQRSTANGVRLERRSLPRQPFQQLPVNTAKPTVAEHHHEIAALSAGRDVRHD